MSVCLEILRADRDAAEPAIAPSAAIPLVTSEQCAAVDETGEHLDCELAEESDPWWLLLAGATVIVSVIAYSVAVGPKPWF